MPEPLFVVVGLGNPGPDYAGNRHNVGQMVLDELARRMGSSFRRHKTPTEVAEGRTSPGGPRLVLAKPRSFMNTSGGPVSAVLRFYDVAPDRLIVVHDELDIPFDVVRLKSGGGHGGHNGLRDIIKAVGTPDFTRVRVGVGRPPGRQDPADFVLHDFSSTERRALPLLVDRAADAVGSIVADGLVSAQQRFHAPE
ncbi:aminoacyl-tRNA hydrolase [Curtobacterium ammoniigenes]|uniref:aminoacyl-tRNA hydrolase n=1 Tax=Curtobacterium ammoniigenes TaxID=395387 RepID=UPI000832FF17|nr:aminoacyl-tRNA hydrolase [Curtobacterium ammoniigenes]